MNITTYSHLKLERTSGQCCVGGILVQKNSKLPAVAAEAVPGSRHAARQECSSLKPTMATLSACID